MSTIPEIMTRERCGYREARRIQEGLSALPTSEPRGASQLVGSGSLGGAPRRPLKRDAWTRGFVCAVAKYIEMYGDGTEAHELVRLAGKRDHILKHADEEDIETLRSAGFLCPNT